MTGKKLIEEIDSKIQLMKKTTEELKVLAEDIPAVERNSSRIMASIKMLEINISDHLHI